MRRFLKTNPVMSLVPTAICCAGAVFCHAQPPSTQPEFEVASVRPTNSTDGRALIQATPGRLAMTNLVLRRLILNAYGLDDNQLVGGPDWVNSTRYDIQAKADGNPSVQQMEGPMLQSLLQERFGLVLHHATRQVEVYKLVPAKGGPKLQPAKEGECVPYSTHSSPPPVTSGVSQPSYCGLHFEANGTNRTLGGKGVTTANLAGSLSQSYTASLGRRVIDRTGLAGTFDIRLAWANEPANAETADAGKSVPQDQAEPSIFTALEEQLGLRLESAKAPVDVFQIDHIEKPSAN
jgi:uncharacterized protein (TIGR03435 family)